MRLTLQVLGLMLLSVLAASCSDDCRGCGAPTPQKSTRNVYGSHWTFTVLPRTIPGCQEVVEQIVAQVMAEYELAE